MRICFVVVILIFIGCNKSKYDIELTKEKAPPTFTARFETTKGEFEVEIIRNLSPKAADRFYQLIKHGYFDDGIFYRVVPEFVAQFGNTNAGIMEQWRRVGIPDEPQRRNNERGTISFASAGNASRDLELFINLKDNASLDTINVNGTIGFPPIGRVSKGMEVVDQLYSGYSEQTMTDSNLYTNRALFYQTYPKLDLIRKAYLVEK